MGAIQRFIPALRFRVLTPLIDLLVRLGSPRHNLRAELAARVSPQQGDRILDFGCGTGSLLLEIGNVEPRAKLQGLDVDPDVLAIARRKTRSAPQEIVLDGYTGQDFPYADHTFTKVVSSLVFHHLASDAKRKASEEFFRVLLPGGELFILDFGPQVSIWGRCITWALNHLEPLDDNLSGRLPNFLLNAGFVGIAEIVRYRTLFGELLVISARKPG